MITLTEENYEINSNLISSLSEKFNARILPSFQGGLNLILILFKNELTL